MIIHNWPVLDIADLASDSGVDWLLLDRFVTDRAAGAVDGTAAEPGPGTRSVVDTGSVVSISSGVLQLGGKTVDNSDPAIVWSEAIALAQGKAIFHTVNIANSGRYYWGVGASGGSPIVFGWRSESNNLRAALSVQCDTFTPGTDVRTVIILRPTGAFNLADNRLLFIDRGTSLVDPVYAVFVVSNVYAVATLDDVGVAQVSTTDPALYPIPVLSDSFDRANGALGSTDGAGHLEGLTTPQGDGVAYSNAATWTISSNAATNTPSGASDYLCYAAGGDAEVFHGAEITRTAGQAGIVLNAADTDNYLRVVHDGTNVITTEVVSGTPNVLSTVAKAYSAGARLEARRIGNDVYVFYNDSFVANVTSNTALQNNTAHGLYSDSSGNTFDNLATWPTTGYSYGEYA